MRFASIVTAVLVCGCGDAAAPPAGTRLFVDTDLPTPEVASRLRIDVTRADGSALAPRIVATEAPSAFPVSFDLAAPESGSTRVQVRLRIYPDTYSDGEEPQAAVTVDRIVTLVATAGEAHEATVILHGACAGLAAEVDTGASCVTAREDGLAPLAEPNDAPSAASHTDDLRESCAGLEVPEGRVCVPGGVFVLGERDQIDYDEDEFLDARTERLVHLHRFMLDQNEIDVARYRRASPTLHEYARYEPRKNDGPLGDNGAEATACTYTTSPGEREGYPLNCLPWGSFRQLCQLEGGDLPTEAQWEYAAALAGGTRERRYPWGDEQPTCDRAVYARIGSRADDYCTASPALVALADPAGAGDVTPLGLRSLAGSMSEYVQDAPSEYTDEAWLAQPFTDPRVDNPIDPGAANDESQRFVARGGSWVSPSNTLRASFRLKVSAASPFYGARCAYPSP